MLGLNTMLSAMLPQIQERLNQAQQPQQSSIGQQMPQGGGMIGGMVRRIMENQPQQQEPQFNGFLEGIFNRVQNAQQPTMPVQPIQPQQPMQQQQQANPYVEQMAMQQMPIGPMAFNPQVPPAMFNQLAGNMGGASPMAYQASQPQQPMISNNTTSPIDLYIRTMMGNRF